MSDLEALLQFNRRPVSQDMIKYLSRSTESIIQVRETNSMIDAAIPAPKLDVFITRLVKYSNVQTPTLMATSVFLSRLRSIIPANVYGIETTRHRIFLGCLILSAKTLNDSSPLNKHWASYTDGILHLKEVNTIERELLEYFEWNLSITTNDLINVLAPFLKPIKEQIMRSKQQDLLLFNAPTPSQLKSYMHSPQSRSSSYNSIPSLSTSSTMSTLNSSKSRSSLNYNNYSKVQTIPENEVSPMGQRKTSLSNLDPNKYANDSLTDRRKSSRPIILKTGLDKPINHAPVKIKKSSWTNFFR